MGKNVSQLPLSRSGRQKACGMFQNVLHACRSGFSKSPSGRFGKRSKQMTS